MFSPTDALLARYLTGNCRSDEAREVERWLSEDPANPARLNELRAIWAARRAPVAPDVDAMWAGVRRTIQADRSRVARRAQAFRFADRGRWWTPSMIAAAVIVLAIGGTLIASVGARRGADANAVEPMREYQTPRGQRATFQLADGTRLLLAAESRLRVPANYGRGLREVHLEGEALFEVVRDTTRPFRVRARNAIVEVLGTTFDVRAYPEDTTVAVAVAEGSVALGPLDRPSADARDSSGTAQGLILRAGEAGTLDTEGRLTISPNGDAAGYLAWIEGRLPFVETPLPEVLRIVGRWYDLDIRAEGRELTSRAVTAEFGTSSAEDFLNALALAVDARITRQGKVVTLRPR